MTSVFYDIRKNLGIKQSVFANELGVSRSTVSMWETGKSYPERKVLDKMIKKYNIDIECITGGSHNELAMLSQRYNVMKEEKNLTDEEISERSGVDIDIIEEISLGQLLRVPKDLRAIASVLGTTYEYLITGAFEAKSPELVPVVKTKYFNVAKRLQDGGIELSEDSINKIIKLAREGKI